MARVLIVNMPFSNLRWPNLGPSLLAAAVQARGIDCRVAYFNFDLAERLGYDSYDWIADYFAFVLGGERLFAKHYFRDGLPGDDAYYADVLLRAQPDLTRGEFDAYRALEPHVEPFLDACYRSVDWADFGLVGFAASFQQTMPSLCLARRIKHSHPQLPIVFGGAACEGEMGVELLRSFPEVDHVFLGEADCTFPPLVERVLAGRAVEPLPGVVSRGGRSGEPPAIDGRQEAVGKEIDEAELVRDLDGLPFPDFDDYFARWRESPLREEIEPLLFFETSRGCWWGQKHHCKFCGLNGSSMAFRSKSPQRAIDELRYLTRRHGVGRACSADNILDFRYFHTLLPMLAEADFDLAFVCELKTNLTREQVEMLLAAGMGAAQLGIETFSTPILRLMDKGVTGVQNIQTLKWFSEAAIEIKWNVLWGFPGEDPAEYARLASMLPALFHLHPPLACGQVRMDRFSPYFQHPGDHGMLDPRPNRAFRYVYRLPDESLARLAYYYEFDFADGRVPRDYADPLLDAVERWQELQGTVTLRQWDRPDGLLILTDTRPGAVAFQTRLTGLERKLYLYCDTARSWKAIRQWAEEACGGSPPDEAWLRAIVDGWIAGRLMLYWDDRYLSLALRAPEERPAERNRTPDG